MLLETSEPRGPTGTQLYQAAAGPTIATWKEHKSRRYKTAEIFQDLQRHPWVGERQAGRAMNLFDMRARGVDQDLRALPYGQRLQLPASGNWPVVQGIELGPGPNPWDPTSLASFRGARKRGVVPGHVRSYEPWNRTPPGERHTKKLPLDDGGYQTGPQASANRTWADRLGRVGKHAADKLGETVATALGAGGAYVATGSVASAIKGGQTGRGAYRRFSPYKRKPIR